MRRMIIRLVKFAIIIAAISWLSDRAYDAGYDDAAFGQPHARKSI